MTNSIENIIAEFDKLKPGIEETFYSYFERTVGMLLEEFEGNMKGLRALGSNYGYKGDMYRAARPFMKNIKEGYSASFYEPQKLNEEYLRKQAKQYADDQVAAFAAKLRKKMIDLENVSNMTIRNSAEFFFNGEIEGHKVLVEQTCVFKVSNRGKPFNQWPCRIYVDGKMMPERTFKKTFGQA